MGHINKLVKRIFGLLNTNESPQNIEKKKVFAEFTDEEIHELSIHLLLTFREITRQIDRHDFNTDKNGEILRNNNFDEFGSPLYKFDKSGNPDLYNSVLDYNHIINMIMHNRQSLITNLKGEPFKYGRILGFETLQSMPDGFPIQESNGLVDNYDIPPIDTWIYYKSNFKKTHNEPRYSDSNQILFCWIPSEAVKIMQHTMDGEALDTYFWLDECYPKIQDRIEKEIKKIS
jgi:hypothetical protein